MELKNLSRRAFVFSLAVLAAVGLAFHPTEDIKPDLQHARLGQAIPQILSQYHYAHFQLSDSLSSEILKRYLEDLDYNRVYFLDGDIRAFEAYRSELDDDLKEGNLAPVYDMFNTFKRRVAERMDYISARLREGFDFTTDEEMLLDRSHEPWPKSNGELNELWRKRLKNDALNLKLAGKEWPDIVSTLEKRYQNFQKRLEQYDTEEVFQLFMNAVAQSFDPHTNYFSPITSDNFKIRISLSFEGIGARLTTEDDYTRVVEIIPGGPADMSKQLQPNDKIIGVAQGDTEDFVDVIGWRIDDVVQRIRGKRGTVVRLQIIPADAEPGAAPKVVRLVRDKVKLEEQAAKGNMLEIKFGERGYKFGVINVPTFYSDYGARQRGEKDYKSTTRDVKRLITELQAKGAEGIIIDLRGNGGGILQEAIDLTGLFIKAGPVVQVRNSNGSVSIGADRDGAVFYDGPLAVVVDRLSASASEIFAAAIQDYGRGVIIGGQTFGKGTVQHLLSLNEFLGNAGGKLGQLKVTVSKFYRINGGSTQHRGVLPDIVLPSRYNAMNYGESTEINALMWDHIQPTRYVAYNEYGKYLPELRSHLTARVAADPEFQALQDEIAEIREKQAMKTISLNEAVRKQEREKAEAKHKKRDALSHRHDGEKTDEKKGEGDEQTVKEGEILREVGLILADYLQLRQQGLTGPVQ